MAGNRDQVEEATEVASSWYPALRELDGRNNFTVPLVGVTISMFNNPYFATPASEMPPNKALPIFQDLDVDCPCGGIDPRFCTLGSVG
jgi:hypothetical protein